MLIGADIGGTHMRSALVDDRGTILLRRKVETAVSAGPEQVAERLVSECKLLLQRADGLGSRVEAVGLGVAGKIDRHEGRVLFSPNLAAMKDYPLAREVRMKLGTKVVMENDANVFGIGESRAGAGRGIRNWIGITLGTGVGGCLILEDRLWLGDDLGFVGEIGHTIVQPEGPLCVCGLRGCLEAHASGRALREGVETAVAEGILTHGPLYERWREGNLTAEFVYLCAKQGNSLAQGLFERMGWALGLALANLFTTLGIRHGIIGGGVSAGWDLFIDPLRRSLAKHTSMLDAREMVVLKSSLGDDAALLGAASLARESIGIEGFQY